jgi:ABC-type lipoprotein export system ATPase subunit
MIINNIEKEYDSCVALQDVSFTLPEEGFIFVNGISGSGKTTLMNIMSGLDVPTSGEVLYGEQNICKLSKIQSDDLRNLHIGIVFQSFNLIDGMTVEENLAIPLRIQNLNVADEHTRIQEVLKFVDMEGYEKRYANELSAGQRQRIAIARAIIKHPKIIFADEATGNLDESNTEHILELFDKISKSCLLVLISHDSNAAKKYADRIITLSDGKVIHDVDNRYRKALYNQPYYIEMKGEQYHITKKLVEFDLKDEIVNLSEKMNDESMEFRFSSTVYLENKETDTTEKDRELKGPEPESKVGRTNMLIKHQLKRQKGRKLLSVF